MEVTMMEHDAYLELRRRKELDNIYEAIAALSVKVPEARKQPRPIGFKLPKEEK